MKIALKEKRVEFVEGRGKSSYGVFFVKFFESIGIFVRRQFQRIEGNSAREKFFRRVDPVGQRAEVARQVRVEFVSPTFETEEGVRAREGEGEEILPVGKIVEQISQLFEFLTRKMSALHLFAFEQFPLFLFVEKISHLFGEILKRARMKILPDAFFLLTLYSIGKFRIGCSTTDVSSWRVSFSHFSNSPCSLFTAPIG